MLKGQTVLEEMRKYFKNQCVTTNEIMPLVTRSRGYLREVLDRAASAGIIEKKEKCVQFATCYEIDPRNGKVVCPLEPNKPYDESICRVLEESIENEVESLLHRDPLTDMRIHPNWSGNGTNLQNACTSV